MTKKQLRYTLPDGREHIIDIYGPGDEIPTPEQMLHDCPECRAAMERGEKPTILTPEELKQMAGIAANESRQVRRARLRRMTKGRRTGN